MSDNRNNGRQRIAFYEGQRLTAPDLQDDVRYEDRMRALHVRAMHDTWGVAFGFEVTASGNIITVSPGTAYDCYGRLIVSARERTIQLPPPVTVGGTLVDTAYDLVIAYRQQPVAPGLRVRFTDSHFHPLEEQPTWRWVLAQPRAATGVPPHAPVRLGEELPLVRVNLKNGVLDPNEPFDAVERRHAQRMVRPRIATGQVDSVLEFDVPVFFFLLDAGFIFIDTTEAGFNDVPAYSVAVTLPQLLRAAQDKDHPQYARDIHKLHGPFVSILFEDRDLFVMSVRFGINDPGLAGRIGSEWAAGTPFGRILFPDYDEDHVIASIHWSGIELLEVD